MNKSIKIPGKTFLFGEYIATKGGASLIFTSQPLFELKVELASCASSPFHPESPAGKFYQKYQTALEPFHFDFINPYQLGGLGASTAEFLSLYLFTQSLVGLEKLTDKALIELYQSFNIKTGIKPSGADLIGQMHQGIHYFYPNKNIQKKHPWPFDDLSLILFHTNKKLATHEHLQTLKIKNNLSKLQNIADNAYQAFTEADSQAFIDEINHYSGELKALNLVANHSQAILSEYKKNPLILASKGCGALGADVIMLLCKPSSKAPLVSFIKKQNYPLIADETSLQL